MIKDPNNIINSLDCLSSACRILKMTNPFKEVSIMGWYYFTIKKGGTIFICEWW